MFMLLSLYAGQAKVRNCLFDNMSNRASLDMSRASSELSADGYLNPSESILSSNPKSIAYLVYANRGDPLVAGYKPPTTRDIPQIKLPRVGSKNVTDLSEYLDLIRRMESSKELQEDLDGIKPNGDLLPLSNVPDVFFNMKFELNNPRIFDAVINQNDSAILQEKLSSYVDIVESHLTYEIAKASTNFFEAALQFDAIESQSLTTNSEIAKSIETANAQKEVLAHYRETELLQRKLKDADSLCEAIKYLANLQNQVRQLELSVTNDVDESLSQLEDIREKLTSGKIDLKRVIAAQPLLERVEVAENQLRSKIRIQYSSQMIEALRSINTNKESDSGYESMMTQARKTLEHAAKLGAREACLSQYGVEVDREVKLTVRRNLPMSGNDTNQSTNPEKSQFLARSLHTLLPNEAADLFQRMFDELTSLISAIASQKVPEVSSKLIETAVLSADSRVSRVLRVRKDSTSMLSIPDFLKLHAQVSEFCDFVESASSLSSTELREFLVAQTKLYSHCLQTKFDDELKASMEADDWRKSEISGNVQICANIINKAYLQDPPFETEQETKGEQETTNQEKNSALRLEIDSQTFLLCRSSTLLIEIVAGLLQLVSYLPPLQSISASRVVLEILQSYNYRAFHQVVQHGAVKTAGLKHINIRNLLVSHESLRMIERLINPIKHCVERHSLSADNSTVTGHHNVAEAQAIELFQAYDTVQQKYFDHRSEIQQRIVKLLGDKANIMAKQILATDWKHPRTAEGLLDRSGASLKVSANMVDLMRQTVSVANTCQEMIPNNIAEDIVAKIFATFKPKLLEAYTQLEIKTVTEKRNALRDIEYFRAKSSTLRGAGNIADVIYESFNTFVAPDIVVGDELQEPDAEQTIDNIDQTMVFDQESKHDTDAPILDSLKADTEKELPEKILERESSNSGNIEFSSERLAQSSESKPEKQVSDVESSNKSEIDQSDSQEAEITNTASLIANNTEEISAGLIPKKEVSSVNEVAEDIENNHESVNEDLASKSESVSENVDNAKDLTESDDIQRQNRDFNKTGHQLDVDDENSENGIQKSAKEPGKLETEEDKTEEPFQGQVDQHAEREVNEEEEEGKEGKGQELKEEESNKPEPIIKAEPTMPLAEKEEIVEEESTASKGSLKLEEQSAEGAGKTNLSKSQKKRMKKKKK